ncbi:MAG: hypothetical protein MSIBF_00275 [Candidatus Altiarchaeales archaeon IMC4]|nr:MAG: hypothetical protein MSIBF_00275 [Candidatus Altiarchaeales archaeon IMC4]
MSTPRYRFDILKFLWNFKAIKSLRDFNVFRDCEIKSACERIFREIAEAYGLRKIALQFLHTKSLCDLLVTIYELQVMPDHIHLFVGFGPNTCPSEVVRLFKGVSARKLFQEFPRIRVNPQIHGTPFATLSQMRVRRRLWGGHLWSKGKFYRSVGNVTADTVKHYIAQSHKHLRLNRKWYPRNSFEFRDIICLGKCLSHESTIHEEGEWKFDSEVETLPVKQSGPQTTSCVSDLSETVSSYPYEGYGTSIPSRNRLSREHAFPTNRKRCPVNLLIHMISGFTRMQDFAA